MQEIARLEELVESTRGDIQHLVPLAARALKDETNFHQVTPDLPSVPACLDRTLIHSVLRRALLSDVELEVAFTVLRKGYLRAEDDLAEHRTLMISIAAQCFNNDYVWGVTPGETLQLERLRLRKKLSSDELIKLAMYQPLWKLSPALLQAHLDECATDLDYLLSKQVHEPRRELEIQVSVPSLGAIEDPVSRKVAEQYETSPYPRWFSIPPHSPEALSDQLCAWCPIEFCSLSTDILVPGCGTGQHPVHLACTFPESRVISLDLSLPSLAYGKRRAEEIGVNNIEFWHGDLLSLEQSDEWRGRFGFIDSVGVLHHLVHPSAGCRALLQVLAPGGLVRVGLYSRLARHEAGIDKARTNHVQGESLREARLKLLHSDLPRFLDFFTLHGFRDLLFPAQETCYSLPEAVDMLREGGLRVVSLQVSREVETQFLEEFGPNLTDWSSWERYERLHPRTFASMYHLLAVAA